MHTINPSAILLLIKSDSVLINGTSYSWKYRYSYFTEDNKSSYFFHTTKDSAIFDSLNNSILIGAASIKKPFVDSDSALVLAENQGGKEFRDSHPNCKITASLGESLVPNSTPRWYIYYISIDDPSEKLFINLDATENSIGNVVNSQIPNNFILYQNYPNPFNPITTIKFSIPKNGYVKLKVYDLIGKEMSNLTEGYKVAGSYNVQFDGSEFTSGIYFYKLEFEAFTKVKKFILIK
jgi:hypothetical protein